MIASHDEMRDTHVLAKQGMQQRLARTRIEHVKAVARHHHGIGREGKFHHLANAGIANLARDVAGLELAEQHMDDAAVGLQAFHGDSAELLVGEMHGVAGLKRHRRFPAQPVDLGADIDRRSKGMREIQLEVTEVEDIDRPRHAVAAETAEFGDARVAVVGCAENCPDHGIQLAVVGGFNARHLHHRE